MQNQIEISQKCKYFINSRLCRPSNVEENKITTDLDGENSVMSFFERLFVKYKNFRTKLLKFFNFFILSGFLQILGVFQPHPNKSKRKYFIL